MRSLFYTLSALSLMPTALLAHQKDFSGPFVGGLLGGSFGTVGADVVAPGASSFPISSLDNNGGGIEGGVVAGYLFKISPSFPLHIGVEGGTTVSSLDGSKKKSASVAGGTVSARHKFSRPHAFQVSGILGYPVTDTIMPFIKVGWENALWKHKVRATAMSGGMMTTVSGSNSERQHALLVGGGVRKKITKEVDIGLEYQGSFHFDKQHTRFAGMRVKHDKARNHKFLTTVIYRP